MRWRTGRLRLEVTSRTILPPLGFRTPRWGFVAALAVFCVTSATAQTSQAADADFPLLEIRAAEPGPTVALVAGIHGGKRAAVAALQRLGRELPAELRRGRVLILAPANARGFAAGLAQLSPDDSLNLNRVFPGAADGRPTERLAARILRDIVSQSDYLLDLHGSDGDEAVGRFTYAARPGLDARVDSAARQLAVAWGTPLVVWDQDGPRSLETSRFLQTAAHLSGVPAITVFESGATRDDAAATTAFVAGSRAVLRTLRMLDEPAPSAVPALPEVLARREVVLAAQPGTWQPLVQPGQRLRRGEPLGSLRGSSGTAISIAAPVDGIVLHQRLPSDATTGTPLVILGVLPSPR